VLFNFIFITFFILIHSYIAYIQYIVPLPVVLCLYLYCYFVPKCTTSIFAVLCEPMWYVSILQEMNRGHFLLALYFFHLCSFLMPFFCVVFIALALVFFFVAYLKKNSIIYVLGFKYHALCLNTAFFSERNAFVFVSSVFACLLCTKTN